ncbi:37S ribosomal protein S16, mitochondrial [Cryptotrichosporon argae]
MPVRIRLARHGQRHTPVYHIVAINSTQRRDARPLEKLGEYDPIPRLPPGAVLPPAAAVWGGTDKVEMQREKRIEWNVERIRYWLDVGAQPTRSVVKLLERGGVLTTPHKWQHPWSPPQPQTTTGTAASST